MTEDYQRDMKIVGDTIIMMCEKYKLAALCTLTPRNDTNCAQLLMDGIGNEKTITQLVAAMLSSDKLADKMLDLVLLHKKGKIGYQKIIEQEKPNTTEQ